MLALDTRRQSLMSRKHFPIANGYASTPFCRVPFQTSNVLTYFWHCMNAFLSKAFWNMKCAYIFLTLHQRPFINGLFDVSCIWIFFTSVRFQWLFIACIFFIINYLTSAMQQCKGTKWYSTQSQVNLGKTSKKKPPFVSSLIFFRALLLPFQLHRSFEPDRTTGGYETLPYLSWRVETPFMSPFICVKPDHAYAGPTGEQQKLSWEYKRELWLDLGL